MRLRFKYCFFSAAIIVSAGIALRGARPGRASYQWFAEASLVTPRSGACAALLPDGSVLISGGHGPYGTVNSVEVFSRSGKVAIAAAMMNARADHVCAALPDGRVLVAGGSTDGGGATNGAEVYDSGTQSWSATGPMVAPRAGATASMLPDGRVLIAGGESSGTALATLEVFDGRTNRFDAVRQLMSSPRKQHAAAALADGRVLLAGGSDGEQVLDTVDIYDPATASISLLGRLSTPRAMLSAVTLLDSRVYFAGGSDGAKDLASAELYDPVKDGFSEAPPMSVARKGHVALRIPHNNSILLVGGTSNGKPSDAAELFVPWWNSYKPLPALSGGRAEPAVSPLKIDGEVMVAGGATAQAQTGSVNTLAGATITTDKADYQPGDQVTISGANWMAGEVVTFNITRSPNARNLQLTTAADSNGTFVYRPSELVMTASDVGQTYTITASGNKESTAQAITFTDAANYDTTTALSQIPTPVSVSQAVTFSGTVKASSTTEPQPQGGSVELQMTDSTCNVVAITATVSLNITTTPPSFSGSFTAPATGGPYYYRARYTGYSQGQGSNGINWQKSNSACQTITVNAQAATSLSVASVNSTFGGTLNLSAVLTSAGVGVSGKTVSFTVNGTPVGSAATNTSGIAVLSSVGLSGINAGTYTSGLGASFAGDSAYASSSGTGSLTVSQRSVTVAADAKTKVYGDADPALTYQVTSGSLVGSDNFTGSLTRTSGESVVGSPYAIQQGSLSLGGNYTLTFVGSNLTITKKPAAVTPAAASKTYGEADPSPLTSGTLNGFVASDHVTATYSRTAGETVAGGPYTISATLSPAAVLDNYTITYNTASFTITKRNASVTPNAATKTYGDADAAFSGTLSGFLAADNVTAAYSRTPGETVAGSPYTISATLSPAGVLGNYAITYNTASFAITPKSVTASVIASNKIYDGLQSATTTCSVQGVLPGDAGNVICSAAAATFDSANVGTWQVTATGISLSGGAAVNYVLSSTTATTTAAITPKAASVTPNGATKTYGDPDPAFSGTLNGFIASDGITPSYSRTAGETVAGSPYTISATLSPAVKLGNYTITYNTASFTITKRNASVTPNAATKTYGDADAAFSGTLSGFLAADNVTAAYSRTAGETVAGSPYTISAALSPAGVLSNYVITYNTATFTIIRKPITVTADSKTKILAAPDPTLTYQVAPALRTGDAFSGTLMRDAGETIGIYAIRVGTLTAGTNYALTFVGATLTITYAPAGTSCLGQPGHTILQPIDASGASVFKQGSTVPAKFRVCDANGNSIGSVGVVSDFRLVQTINGTASSDVNEAVDSTTPDNAFRWDPTAQQWIFNINTKALQTTYTYVYQIKLNDGSSIPYQFGLK